MFLFDCYFLKFRWSLCPFKFDLFQESSVWSLILENEQGQGITTIHGRKILFRQKYVGKSGRWEKRLKFHEDWLSILFFFDALVISLNRPPWSFEVLPTFPTVLKSGDSEKKKNPVASPQFLHAIYVIIRTFLKVRDPLYVFTYFSSN